MYRPAPLVRTHVSGVAPGTGVGRGVRAGLGAGADRKSCGCASRGGGALALAELGQDGQPFLLAMAMQGPVSSGLVGYFSDQDRLGSAVRTAHPAEDEAGRTSSLKTVVNWPIAPAPSLQDGFRTSN